MSLNKKIFKEDLIGLLPIEKEELKEEILKEIERISLINLENNDELVKLINDYINNNEVVISNIYLLINIHLLAEEINDRVSKEYLEDYFEKELKLSIFNDLSFYNIIASIRKNFLESVGYCSNLFEMNNQINECIESLEYANDFGIDDYLCYEYPNEDKSDIKNEFIKENDERKELLLKNKSDIDYTYNNRFNYNEKIEECIKRIDLFIAKYIIKNHKYKESDYERFDNFIFEKDPNNFDYIENLVRIYFDNKIKKSKQKKIY